MDNLARQPRFTVIEGTKHRPSIAASIVPEPHDAPPSSKRRQWPTISKESSRWLSSLCIVMAVYAAPLIWWMMPADSVGTNTPPPAAMVVELAPVPVAPASEPDIPPGPKQAEEIPPPKPEPEPTPEPEPELAPTPAETKPEVAVKPKPEPTLKETPPVEKPPPIEPPEDVLPKKEPASSASAPPDAPQEDVEAAAPDRGVSVPAANSNAIPTWQNTLMLKLNEAKRYPRQARRYRQEGIAYLRFTMDRDGNVLTKSIEQSSGHPLLDEETMELIDRAQPLPKPPAEMRGDALEFVVPVEFFLNR